MIIGLTGGIATGKSTVSAMLVSRGALLVDADVIAREVMLPGHPVLAAVRERFGPEVMNDDGTLNRKELGRIVFGNQAELQALNNITHPAIRQEIKQQMTTFELQQPDKLVVVDIPLLYESKLDNLFQEVMVVYVPRTQQLQRLMERDELAAPEAEQRLAAQMDIEEKKRKADIVVDNSKDLQYTEQQLEQWLRHKRLS
ncbi:dephospho-CoA kinase [Paenibacillus massiliensis]|uniref:dephospho-CoA kinase n=1 Tax=Paenibacillus massiliensis TaxID=225917 RepID=UPI000471D217|nr:dephospho-CoA kinase [Paenibacillus massiliensis]